MEKMSEVSRLLSEMIDGGTFTKEALANMNAALSKVEMLEGRLKDSEEDRRALAASRDSAKAEASKCNGISEGFAKREADVTARETKITELEKAAAVANAKAEVYGTCFDKVFRNFTVNKNVTGSVPFPPQAGGGGYVNSGCSSENTTETVS